MKSVILISFVYRYQSPETARSERNANNIKVRKYLVQKYQNQVVREEVDYVWSRAL
jgi:hypothetical protein